MASFALTAAGAIGGFFVGGPAGIVTGAKIGAALGGVVDGSLFGDDLHRWLYGPRSRLCTRLCLSQLIQLFYAGAGR